MSVPDWIGDPALAPAWARIRRRLEQAGLTPTGRVRVSTPDRETRRAVGDLVGRDILRGSIEVDLAALEVRLRERSGLGGLSDVLPLVTSGPLVDRPAQTAARARARTAPLERAASLVDAPWAQAWGEAWVDGLRRTGILTGRADARDVVEAAAAVLRAILDAPPSPRSRVELAAQVLGDAHALDRDRLVHAVVLRGLAAAAGAPLPRGAGARERLWSDQGIEPDLLSRTCLTLGLTLDGHATVDPRHLTLWDLRRHSITATRVLVCENPRVLEAVAEAGVPHTVVCTSGQPNLVVHETLRCLVDHGCELLYHGDLDWPGVSMANRMLAAYGARPWFMGATHYAAHVHADGPALTGRPVAATWDAALTPAMSEQGRALHEETMLPTILVALRLTSRE